MILTIGTFGQGTGGLLTPSLWRASVTNEVDVANPLHSLRISRDIQGLVHGNNCTMSGSNSWVDGFSANPLSFDINTTVAGKMYLNFSGSGSQAVKLANIYTNLDTINVKFRARLNSGTTIALRICTNFATSPVSSFSFTPTAQELEYTGQIIGASNMTDIFIMVISASNTGGNVEIDDFEAYKTTSTSSYPNEYKIVDLTKRTVDLETNNTELFSYTGKKANSEMNTNVTDWKLYLGAVAFDVNTTIPGKMYLPFTSNNQAVYLTDILTSGQSYQVRLKARLNSGTATSLRIGKFVSSGSTGMYFDITPSSTEKEYWGTLTSIDVTLFSIGVLDANNNGSDYEIDDVRIYKDNELIYRLAKTENVTDGVTSAHSANTSDFLQSLSLYDKPLTTMVVFGNSLMANNYGGTIAGDINTIPPRLVPNNIPRRIYDYLNTNYSPIAYRGLTHANWTLTGSWAFYDSSKIFDPDYGASTSSYLYTSTKLDSASIVLGDTVTAFSLIVYRNDSLSTTYFTDSLLVYVNDTLYSVNSTYHADYNSADRGNPYWLITFDSLSTAITKWVRIVNGGYNEIVALWGIAYWDGNGFMLFNSAHGGHTMAELISHGHFQAQVLDNNPDAVLLEIPLMNETAHTTSPLSVQSLITICDSLKNKDVAFMSTNPMGKVGAGTNYYTLYPGQEARNDSLRAIVIQKGKPYIDVFHYFKLKTANRGGTLDNGDAGFWTSDGQHPNTAGALEWFNFIKSAFLINKPITF